jgi:L-rhamnose mutarotase
METIAFRMVLNPGMREEYERRHQEICWLMHCVKPACATTASSSMPAPTTSLPS